ncbi:MAG: helix-turn-helix domain-containing protein [Oscillospiraceae bacterium]|nr:helix-turn-helix domain-containing protein [Oscillospiraceae bacterium]
MEYTLDYKLIGERIKQRRLMMKLTQDKLSEAVGIGVQHLSKIENGKAPLSLTCLVAIANALQTTTDCLLMDNMPAAMPNILKEAQTLLADCSTNEIYIILKTATTVKECIRHKGLSIPPP